MAAARCLRPALRWSGNGGLDDGAARGKNRIDHTSGDRIGRATARMFAQNGARVVLFGLGDAELDAAAAETSGEAVPGDVTESADIVRAIESCGERLDVVVNAAGLIIPDQPLNVSDDVWARTLEVNLTGTMWVCRAALPLVEQEGGAIVNIASSQPSMRIQTARVARRARRLWSRIRARLLTRMAPILSVPKR